jgi:hypothetical protein
MKKPTIIFFLLFIILASIAFYFIYNDRKDANADEQEEHTEEAEHSDEFHLHAAFKIVKNDQVLNFTDGKYMYYKPCGGEEEDMMTVQDKVHLHNFIGDITHVHSEGIIWRNLFESLGEEQPTSYIGYLNGEVVVNLLDMEIKEYDKVLFIIGEVSAATNVNDLLDQIPDEARIKEIEKQVENCGKK